MRTSSVEDGACEDEEGMFASGEEGGTTIPEFEGATGEAGAGMEEDGGMEAGERPLLVGVTEDPLLDETSESEAESSSELTDAEINPFDGDLAAS
jgi:hypothetical protein